MKVTFNEFKDADRIFIVASIKIGEYSSFKSRGNTCNPEHIPEIKRICEADVRRLCVDSRNPLDYC